MFFAFNRDCVWGHGSLVHGGCKGTSTFADHHRIYQELQSATLRIPPPMPDEIINGTAKVQMPLADGYICIQDGCDKRYAQAADLYRHLGNTHQINVNANK